MKYSSGTFSGTKSMLCVENFVIMGHHCTPSGRKPDESKVTVIRNWGPCQTLSEVRAFLGPVGLMRIYIRNYAHRINALTKLTCKDVPFEWGSEQSAAQDDIKQAVLDCPALKPIDYTSDSPVILAVDTSQIAVGYYLCQEESENSRKRIYNRFGSITLNDRERRFSQPKLELYGLYRALRTLRLYIIGV